ncbi:response regulator [Candidatus Aerophobetes bacterium]|uniref:Response regulator n=1 Tax=Aerophobetes bacterium TaxID=2030807 RepID=A0A7V5HZZ1_UNCAE|nr:response regulator [Candidatus Aerophobetes bacterium]HHF98696.1 response regulator [Candidatus Aerophobetes bacterium]
MKEKKTPRVFVVDDERSVQLSLKMILKGKYEVFTFDRPEKALLELSLEPDLIFTDIRMFSMNGIEFLEKVKRKKPDVEVIVITAYPDFSSSIKALRLGAFDYIVKPFGKEQVLNAAEKALQKRDFFIENTKMIQDLQKAVELNYEATTKALVLAVDAKDSYTAEHSRRTSELLVKVGRRIGIQEEKLITYKRTAELHDIGKIGIEESILRKKEPLSPSEFERMKQHPTIGYQILRPTTFLKEGLSIVLYHHERFDGRGYPEGLKAKKIPLPARLFAIIDAYDAMTTERCYRKKLSPLDAIDEIIKAKGKQFDPEIVDLVVPHLLKFEKNGSLYNL